MIDLTKEEIEELGWKFGLGTYWEPDGKDFHWFDANLEDFAHAVIAAARKKASE